MTKEAPKVAKKAKSNGFSFKMVGQLSKMFWILAACYAIISMTYFRFLGMVADFLTIRFGYSLIQASNLVTLLPILNMILIPIFSSVVTVKGKKAGVLLLSNIVALVIYIALFFLPVDNTMLVSILVLSLSIFFSLYISVFWSCVTLCIPTQIATLGYGCCTLAQSVATIILAWLFGVVTKTRTIQSFNYSLMLLIVMSLVGIGLTAWLLRVDTTMGHILQLPENDIRVKKLSKDMDKAFKKQQRAKAKLLERCRQYEVELKSQTPGRKTDVKA